MSRKPRVQRTPEEKWQIVLEVQIQFSPAVVLGVHEHGIVSRSSKVVSLVSQRRTHAL
jgi:hypothetical protein